MLAAAWKLWLKRCRLLSSLTASISTFGPTEASAFSFTLYVQSETYCCLQGSACIMDFNNAWQSCGALNNLFVSCVMNSIWMLSCSTKTRDRLKLIPRVSNLDEWAQESQLSGAVSVCSATLCAVLCCAVLCCAVLCCAVLCCAVLRCAALRCAALHCPVLCCEPVSLLQLDQD